MADLITKKNNDKLNKVYTILYQNFGPQKWWPGETPFEVIIGAILTQNTAWTNVAQAIENIKKAKSLDPSALYQIPPLGLQELIRPSGYFRVKAQRLKAFIDHLFQRHEGSLEKMLDQDIDKLRVELLGIKGIGQETADSIILYAANKPIFVVDAYTKRIFSRHSFFPDTWEYEEIQYFFMANLPKSVDIFNEYHALIVKLGKDYCKKRPSCHECPLSNLIDGL